MSAPGLQLTDRDRALLDTIKELRVLTTRQVQRLLFPSEQIALRRLRLLDRAGYLRLTTSVVTPYRLVTLTRAGAAAVSDGNGSDLSDHARSGAFLQHRLGVNAFRLALGQACARRPELELLGFVADTDGVPGRAGMQPRRVLTDVLGTKGGHVPDGAFALRRAEHSALFFFEFDRGTEVLGNPQRGLGRIITSYLHAFTGNGYLELARSFGADRVRGFHVLVVTTSPARIANLRRLWAERAVGQIGKRFIWLATASVLEAGDLLTEPWLPLDAADSRTYSILGDNA